MIKRNRFFSHAFFVTFLFSVGVFPVAKAANRTAINLYLGASSFNFGNQKNIVFPAQSFRTDTFNLNNNPMVLASGLGVTYDFLISPKKHKKIARVFRDINIGVNAYYHQTSRQCTVYEYGLANFANSSYNMQMSSARLMLDTEFGFPAIRKQIFPFVEIGLGVARNTMSFTNTPYPNIGAEGGGYSLANHAIYQFAYEVGGGVKVPVNKKVILSGRYLYANAGQAKSSTSDPASGVTLGQAIKVNMASQSVLFGFSYLFG